MWLVAIRHDSEHQKSIRVHVNLRVQVYQLSQCNELPALRAIHRWRNPVRIVGAPMSMRAQSGRGSSKLAGI